MLKFLVRRSLASSSSGSKLLERFLFPCSHHPISSQSYAVSTPIRSPNNTYSHRVRVFGSDAVATASTEVSPSTSDGLTIDRIIAHSWTILDEHESDWKSHASAIAQSLHLIKKRLKWDELMVRLGLLSAELNKPNLWDDPVHAGRISRDHGMLMGKMKEVKAFEQALYEHIDMLKLAREEGDDELESESMNALLEMRKDLKDKELEALLSGDTDPCSCFIEFLLFQSNRSSDLPPGTTGWPFIGETLEFLSTGWKGHPERFVFERMSRFSQNCFRTSILGESDMAMMCGAQGNKFLFSNENKLVEAWWPAAVEKVFPSSTQTSDSKEEAKKMRKMLPQFLKPEALQRYVGVMDCIARRHFAESWEGKDEILVFPLAMRYTFWLACKIFLSLEDPNHIARFANPFHYLASGIISIPIDLPGTPFNRAIKAAKFIRKELKEVIRQRKVDLVENKATTTQDILSHMLTTPIEAETKEPQFMNEDDIADKILGLLIGGHDTASAAITFTVKYLAELPHVYDQVYKEQMEITKGKEEGELLTWDDLKKMKYSWNVACEVMRLAPPLQGAFREALHDFTFSGFRVPKGWKLYWSANSTHLNPEYFPEPQKFDPSRFEGNGPAPYTYVPFGGGPRMCPGKEYARLEILVFMHHVVKRFKWQKLIPDEKIVVNPLPIPAKGLPIRIVPHKVECLG